jgi:hypothetical protein
MIGLNKKIQQAQDSIYKKLQQIDLSTLPISDYNKRYLSDYLNNYQYYMHYYSRIIKMALTESKGNTDKFFIDYGGGIGMLSYLAIETGFKNIVYNDIYDVSVNDVKILSRAIGLIPTHFVHGDIDSLVKTCNKLKIDVGIVCSFDVLEHIYNIEEWFEKATYLDESFSLIFCTSANGSNPVVRKKLMKMQIKSEFSGHDIQWGHKERDTVKPFLQIRKEIIQEYDPNLTTDKINTLATQTRGLIKADIIEYIKVYKNKGELPHEISHPTNTCDPYTGNWTEQLIDIQNLRTFLQKNNFTCRFRGTTYAGSKNIKKRIVQKIMNIPIILSRGKCLFFTPNYILLARKN